MILKNKKIKYSKLKKFISSKYFTLVFLFALITFVIVLASTLLLKQSLRLDEAQSLWQSSHSVTGILKVIAQDVHVPLYHFILHFLQLFINNDVIVNRIVSLIFLILTIPATYLLGKTAFNRNVGLFAAFLIAISPFMNWYGNELRMYTMLAFFTVASQLFFIRIIKYNKKTDWYLYALSALFGIFTHYFFFFNLITQAIFYLAYRNVFKKKSLIKFITVAVILAVAFSPWVIYVLSLGSASNTAPLLIKPSTIDFFNTYSQFIFGFQEDSLNTIILSIWPLTILFGFLALKKTKKLEPIIVYFILAALFPILSAFLLSISVRPLFVTRYLIIALPALFILISKFLSTYPKKLSIALHILLSIAMIATLMVEIFNVNTPVKEDYLQVATYLNEKATSQDVIAISAPFTIYPIEYYYNGNAVLSTLPIWHREIIGSVPPFPDEKLPKEVDEIKGQHQNIWLILSYDQGYEKKIKDYFEGHFEKLEEKTFSPGLSLYKYKLRYDTDVK